MNENRNSPALALLLDWNDRDKAVLLSFLTVPLLLFYASWLWYTDQFTEFGRLYLSPDGVVQMYMILLLGMLGWLVLGVIGLMLRAAERESWTYVLVAILYYGLSMVPVGYGIGLMSPMVGVVLLGASLVGFVLFDFFRVFLSFFLSLSVLVVISVMTSAGTLPYAPLFLDDPISKASSSTYWMISQFLHGLPFVLLVFGLSYMLLSRWREREAQTRELARTDGLTGVANRRAIMDILKHELASTRRNSRPFSVVMMDLDHFKSVNDTYGHDAGDHVLIATARVLERTLRESDWVGRYGGEEFVLVLPQTDADTAVQAVERLRNAMSTLVFDVGPASQMRVTASYGVCAVYGEDGAAEPPIERVLMRVEQAMQQAKADGRNCYKVWTPEMATAAASASVRSA